VKKVKYELCGGSDEKKSERDEINWNWDVIDGMEMNQVNMVDLRHCREERKEQEKNKKLKILMWR